MHSSTTDRFVFERRVSLFTGVIVILSILYLVIRDRPFSDANLVVLARIVLSLAVGVVGATIPSFLNITYSGAGFTLRGTGALALFAVTYFGTPHVEALHLPDVAYLQLESEVIRHLADRNNCDTALEEAKKLAELRPHDAVAENLAGDALYCLGKTEEALHAFEASAKDSPSYGPAQYNVSAALIHLRRYSSAKDILEKLLTRDPENISARYNLAVTQAALGHFDKAHENFNKVYVNDQNYDVYLGLGFTSFNHPQTFEAETVTRYFRSAIAIRPGAICVMYGKYPVDTQLRELGPYIDIYNRVKNDERYLEIRAAFDTAFANMVCT
jgi:tetratricopeptide (TPR) repeat protein